MGVNNTILEENTNIYKYRATMRYIANNTVIEIDNNQIKTIAIDSNYKKMNMPMIFLTVSVHNAYINTMEQYQNEGIVILSIKRAIQNSDMPDLYMDYIEDKFIYFMAQDASTMEKKMHLMNGNSLNQESNLDTDREDLYRSVSLGLLSLDHINKNKKVLNGVISGDLGSIMYYITSHLPIVIEPPTNNKIIKNQFLPPMNSVSKLLEYLNSIAVFYDTPYRFFIDFDCSYLISSSGKAIPKKTEDISTISIVLRDGSIDSGSRVQGMTINKDKSMYQVDIDSSDCQILDNHISGKSYSKLIATGSSGEALNKTVIDMSSSNVTDKTRNVRICNENYGLLDNMISSINSSSIQLLIQKLDVDTSVFTMNKEYIIRVDNINNIEDKNRYNGRYLLTRKRELYVNFDQNLTMDLMLLFEKLPDE